LLKENLSVQLAHDDWGREVRSFRYTELSPSEQHGFVRIKNTLGRVLAESDDYQHNMQFKNSSTNTKHLINAVKVNVAQEAQGTYAALANTTARKASRTSGEGAEGTHAALANTTAREASRNLVKACLRRV